MKEGRKEGGGGDGLGWGLKWGWKRERGMGYVSMWEMWCVMRCGFDGCGVFLR